MEQLIQYGLLHCHSENSMKDSPMSVEQLCKQAKALGAPAVALTDHGVLSGIFELVRAAEKYGIKAIPGVEAYVREDDERKRAHLILMAKDYVGYQAICRAVTASNERLFDDYPCFNLAIIEKYFGKGAPGHGHVIATSACVGGILATVLLANNETLNQIEKLTAKQKKLENPNDPAYQGNVELLAEKEAELERLKEERDRYKALSEKKYKMRQKAVSKIKDESERAEAEARLAAEMAESEEASELLAERKKQITAKSKEITAIKDACKDAEKDHAKWKALQGEIDSLKSSMRSDAELQECLERTADKYREIFEEDFYVELQYHGIPEEAFVMPKLASLAKTKGIPVVAANDAHFAVPEDVRRRSIVRALRFNQWMPERPDDPEYFIKTDAELHEWLSQILDTETVNAAFQGIADIVQKCNVEFPHETHYPKFIGEDAKTRLRRLTEDGIKRHYPGGFEYRERVEYELGVIEKMQYTDYLCIVQDYIQYCRSIEKDNPEGVGYAVGPGRGSAAGSLVCYLIGITNVDPMKFGLIFERFLNPERVSSPDIDVDFSKATRSRALDYVRGKYGDAAVCCIMTKSTLAAKAAIKAAARIRGTELYGKDVPKEKIQYYLQLSTALANIVPETPGAQLSECERELREAFPGNKEADTIITDALSVEGVAINYGMHAAGVIIADNGDVGEYLPLMWNKQNDVWTTQCDMVEAEAQGGVLKFDFLGLKNLDIITDCERYIKRNTGKAIDIESVLEEPAVIREIFAKGNTDFIFQFESQGMKSLLRQFRPESLEHLTLLNAIYRPGPMQYKDDITDVKTGKKKPDYVCDAVRKVLENTYGYAVYQEEVMQLCNQVAGFSLGEADQIRRYMSKKKEEKMAVYRPKFIEGLIRSGAEPKRAEAFWEELMAFARYGFNKSHAAAYATLAYYTGWLKYHYPVEYMCAVMNHTEAERLPDMVTECKRLKIKLLPPNVNRSEEDFTCSKGEIIFGLGSIKNVGNSGAETILAERRENGPYKHFKDFLARAQPDKRVCTALIQAGALDLWCSNRAAMIACFPSIAKDISSEKNKQMQAEEETDEKKKQAALDKAEQFRQRVAEAIIPISTPEDSNERLEKEKELVGMYFSGHPLDNFPAVSATEIAKATESTCNLFGIVRNLRCKNRKKDGASMAFFDLEDRSGMIEVCCFTKAYQQYGSLLEEGACLLCNGEIRLDKGLDDEDRYKFYLSSCKAIQKKQKRILITVNDMMEWTDSVYRQVVPYRDDNGRVAIVYDKLLGEFHTVNFRVSPEILTDPALELSEMS